MRKFLGGFCLPYFSNTLAKFNPASFDMGGDREIRDDAQLIPGSLGRNEYKGDEKDGGLSQPNR